MHASDSPFTADWFVISLRWLTLLGLAVALALGGQLTTLPNLLLVALIIWNIVLTVLAGLNRRLLHHREISVAIDLSVAGAFFWLQGGFACPAWWVVLIPLLSAALYFEVFGALIVSAVLAILLLAKTGLQAFTWSSMIAAGLMVLVTILFAGLFGFLSRGVIREIRRLRQEQIAIQQRKQRVDNERLRAIYNLTSTLMATLNYQRVLDAALDLSLSALTPESDSEADDSLVGTVLLFSKNGLLEVGSARRLTSADFRITLPGEKGAIARAIESGERVLIQGAKDDPEIGRIIAFRNCGQIYCFPLRSGFNVYGVLVFGHLDSDYFSQDRVEVLDILGRQAVIAIQNARLYQDLIDERDKMVEVQEEARKKLARDLHDGPTQSVAAMTMRLNLARKLMEKDPEAANAELVRIEDLARRTSKEIRHMLFTLRPLVLESQGLIAALSAMAEKMNETYGQNVIIDIKEKLLDQIEIGKQGVIFYIVEEAITNARKHARAEHIWVRLRPIDRELMFLEIRDDGVGFNVEEMNRTYDSRGSLGMINLRERTALVNGLLHIQSAKGKGTSVQIAIPLTEEAADRLQHTAGKR